MKRTMPDGILSSILTCAAIWLAAFCVMPLRRTKANPQSAPVTPAPPQVMSAPVLTRAAQTPPKDSVPADALKPDLVLCSGHTRSVQALAFSPDGRWLASGGYDRAIIVWNLASGREEFRLGNPKQIVQSPEQPLNKEAITSLLFSPDGTRLVSVSLSGLVRVWSVATRKMLFAINPHRTHLYAGAVAYSPDGKVLILDMEKRATNDVVQVALGFYDAETGKNLRSLPTKWNALNTLLATPDGRLIASGTIGADDDDDPSGSVQAFDFASGALQKEYPLVASSISPDGRWIAGLDETHSHMVLWSIVDGKRARDLIAKNVIRAVFRPDTQEIALMHGDSSAIDFVSTISGQLMKSLPGAGNGLSTAAYSPDGRFLAAGSYSWGTIKVWDLATMRERVTLYGQSPVQNETFSPDGKLLVAASEELRVWDVATMRELQVLSDAPLNRAAFSADGKWLASNPGGQFPGKNLKIWNTQTWKEAASFTQENGFPVFWFGFDDTKSAQRKIGNAWSWEFESAGESKTMWASSGPLAVSPDGKWLAQPAGLTGTVEIWDTASGRKLESILAYKLAVMKLIVSRDGRWLVSVGQDNNPMMVQGQPGVMVSNPRVSVWDTSSWKLQASVTFTSTAGGDAEISADGKFLTIRQGGGITQLLDLQKKSSIAVLAPPLGRAGSLAFSPDGKLLVQGAQEGIRVWKLSTPPTPAN